MIFFVEYAILFHILYGIYMKKSICYLNLSSFDNDIINII